MGLSPFGFQGLLSVAQGLGRWPVQRPGPLAFAWPGHAAGGRLGRAVEALGPVGLGVVALGPLDLSPIGLGTGALWAQGLSPLGPVALAPCGPGNG